MLAKLLPRRPPRAFPALVLITLSLILLLASRFHHGSFSPRTFLGHQGGAATTSHHSIERLDPELGECHPEINFLRRHKLALTDTIVYSRRCVQPVHKSQFDRQSVTNITRPLITHQTTVNLTSCFHLEPIPCDPLPLPVPRPYPNKRYSHLIFGVASTFERLNVSLPAFSHWLSGTDALLVGVVADAGSRSPSPDFDLAKLQRDYEAAGVKALFVGPAPKEGNSQDWPLTVEQHHFMLIRNLLRLSTPNTKWLGILDDDTFFPSLHPLDQQLKRYDHTKQQWLGALSDNFNNIKMFGYMAYGGAGIFISPVLAGELDPHLEECIEQSTIGTGDGLLRDCIYSWTQTKLTIVPGLYQHDIRGDVSGFFESGVRPLSVHHWKSWYKVPMPKMAAVAGICGDCFLSRYRFPEDMVFVNGYSIAQYPKGLADVDLDKMEGTWRYADDDFDFSYAPLREPLGPEEKKSYRLWDAEATEGGGLKQMYVHQGDWTKRELDEVVELVWLREH